MATVLHETANYRVTALRVGLTIENLISGASVYIQPGDDEATMRDTVDALQEVPENKRDTIADMVLSEYV